MAHSFKLSRRFARLRAPVVAALVLTFIACDSTESFDPESTLAPDADVQVAAVGAEAVAEPQLASASFAGGVPFGMTAQPVSAFGSRFNGAKITVSPGLVMEELAVVRARGGKVAIMLAGNPRHYRDRNGHFDLAEWKGRVNRYRNHNFASYINDGTIIGHYLMDEPNDPRNWSGRPVPPSMLEEMAKYSKQLWPDMPTIVRVQPDYLDNNHRYLDAAWAQYLSRRGNVNDYIRKNVADAERRGLALIVGLNVLKGGTPNGTRMTAKEVEQWGSALLSSSYPCAFLSWTHNYDFLKSSGVGSAMDALRRKAENRNRKSCRA